MRFTGKNLEMVEFGLDLALDELHNRIATCPDVQEYAEDIEAIEALQHKFRRLLDRVRAVTGPEEE